jgi:hypothetical protein
MPIDRNPNMLKNVLYVLKISFIFQFQNKGTVLFMLKEIKIVMNVSLAHGN